MDKKKSFFFITKPLQYFNCTNIEDSNNKFCLIIDNFFNAEKIYTRIKNESNYWDGVFFFKSYSEGFSWIRKNSNDINRLYIDSDYGVFRYRVFKKLKATEIYVYEEGIGNYQLLKTGLKHYILSLLYNFFGNKNYIGGAKYTRGIYLYDKQKHQNYLPKNKKKLCSFKYTFNEYLGIFKDADIFFPPDVKNELIEFSGKKILLYLTSYVINPQALIEVQKYKSEYITLIKPHPHIKDENCPVSFNKIIPSFIMAELLISYLCSICDEVLVLHENSSALLYIRFDNLKTIDIKSI